jgi:hypothetical protein
MVDIEIIAIVVNLAVAFGTILLAYFTYRSVKASEQQVEIARKSIEKPRILENINDIIENVQSDVAGDINCIQKNELVWFVSNERNFYYTCSLVFPISKLKRFFTDFHELVSGPGWDANTQLTNLSISTGTYLSQRYDIYSQINERLISLVKEVRAYLEKNRAIFIRSLDSIHLEENPGQQGFGVRIKSGEKIADISSNEVNIILESLIISSLFKPLQKNDQRMGFLGFQFFSDDLFSKIPIILKENPIPQSDGIVFSITEFLQSLLIIDERIIANIEETRRILRDEYILTEKELNPYKDYF